MSADSCSPALSTLIDRCLVVDGLRLKLLVVSKKFSADCSGPEPGLGKHLLFLPTSF